jgi:hypothetical protein
MIAGDLRGEIWDFGGEEWAEAWIASLVASPSRPLEAHPFSLNQRRSACLHEPCGCMLW